MDRSEFIKLLTLAGAGAMLPSNLKALALNESELTAAMFGNDFIWGTATASHQIEGAWNVDGKGESIWDRFTHITKKIKNRENADIACDFYNRYESDIELMRKMNFNASRFSISWPRILPDGTGAVNQKGLDFYDRVIDKCLKENIDPWITCYHWDLPQKLQDKGGWENRDSLKWYEDYVQIISKKYGDRVKNWMVFNEPNGFTSLGYLIKMHAPGKFGFKHYLPALHHVTLAHGIGGRVLKSNVKDANVGTTFSLIHIDAWKDKTKNQEAAKRTDALVNRVILEPILGMGYPIDDLPRLKNIEKYMRSGDEQKLKFDFDFIGIQNYTRAVMKSLFIVPGIHSINVKPEKYSNDLTEMGWEVYPEGIYKVIKKVASYSGVKKIYITESGAAFPDKVENDSVHDAKRIKYHQDYLTQVLKAKNEGVNIGGYFVWSFMDNFEWAEGYKPRFGLVHVDFETQQRTIKDSGKWFAEFLKNK